MTVLGLTPARGGSKGLPRKNVLPVGGKPLLAWTIEAALAAERLDRYLVSSDDAEIRAVAARHGAETVVRPPALATDETTMTEVMQDILETVDAEIVVLLQCTCPVRDADLIDRCVARLLDTGADSVATGFYCKFLPYAGDLDEHGRERQRQDHPGFFYDNGSVYVIRAELLRKGDRYGRHHEHVIVDKEHQVDIDDDYDLWLAEQVLRRRQLKGAN